MYIGDDGDGRGVHRARTTSASADEKVTVRVSVDPFNIGRPLNKKEEETGAAARVLRLRRRDNRRRREKGADIDPSQAPEWAGGRSHIKHNHEHVKAETETAVGQGGLDRVGAT